MTVSTHELELLAGSGVDDRDRSRRAALEPAQETGRLVEGPLRGAQADALKRRAAAGPERLEPLDRQRQVRAALVRDEGVDLVDDDGVDGRETLAPPGTT